MTRRLCFGLLTALALSWAGCPTTPPIEDGGEPDAPTPDVRMGMCSGDDECSDGNYCNGRERCDAMAASADARGCAAPRGRPCLDVQVCEEATDTCVTDCGVDRDADDDGVDASGCGGMDCDDADPLRYPGATEVCDGEDRDEDCDATTFGARDQDRDGAVSDACCNVSATSVRTCGDDCNDALRGVRPTASEVCDGRDNDCNETIDEGVTVPGFVDGDRDLHGDGTMPRPVCPAAVGGSTLDDDCDDTTPAAHGAQIEICDGRDNDCDGDVDENARAVTWYLDSDGDGFGSAASGTMVSCTPLTGYSLLFSDCDDDNPSISPAAPERCNGLDDDCDGVLNGGMRPGDFEDDDGDGHLDVACGGDDCDDRDWNAYLGAPEICDFRDSDCDGLGDLGPSPPAGVEADATAEVDWFSDVDQDGWGAGSAVHSCEPQAGRTTRSGDCDDEDLSRHPQALDVCDGRDEDCDPQVDEDAVTRAYYADTDGDGDGAGVVSIACRTPPGLTDLPGDCAPMDPSRGPSASEICDRADQDCDLAIDEALFRDADGDGHGDPWSPVTGTCMPSDVGNGDDCDDGDPLVGPSGTCVERCNGDDDDRDDRVDEGAAATCPNAATSMWTCIDGGCDFGGCAALAGNCNAVDTDGCEADLSDDARRCGSCTNVCEVGLACVDGACVADPIVELACTSYSTIARRSSGALVFWGDGGSQAGTVVLGPDFRPRPHGLGGVTSIETAPSAYGGAGCVTVAGGEVRCWGGIWNGYYTRSVLGDGIERPIEVPTRIEPGPFLDLGIGVDHLCGVLAGGSVVCWGLGANGRLGDGLSTTATRPVTVAGLTDAREVEAGGPNSCAIRESGRVVCWGDSSAGQLGSGTLATWPSPGGDVELEAGGFLENVAGVAMGVDRVAICAWRTDGAAFCWGSDFRGQLGAGLGASTARSRAVPVLLSGVREVDAGLSHFCALHGPLGEVSCWGSGDYGQRGDGTLLSSDRPISVPLPGEATDVCTGSEHSCALLVDGRVWCWGHNVSGQAGQDYSAGDNAVESPLEVLGLLR